jgi:hypothetical protein
MVAAALAGRAFTSKRSYARIAWAESFPSVTSSDVYAVLAWYLQHQREADAYVAERDRQADELRKHIEAAQGQHTVTRATLAERLAAKGRG